MSETQPAAPFANYQYEIYLRGMAGEKPSWPVGWAELEAAAEAALDPGPRGYLFGGSGTEDSMRENLEAFRRWRLVPRMLRDVGERTLARQVLGTELHAPVLLAPVGVQSILHPDGELASARAAAAAGVPYVASTASSFTLEEIAEAGGGAPQWFQLYWPRGEELAASFVRRAEAAGYGAIVVTLDTWLLGWRPRDLQQAYLPFLQSIGIANYLADPVFRSTLAAPPEEDPQAAVGQFVGVFSNPTVTWEDLAFLRSVTELPILLKGILSADDARKALDHGVDGILVSNHGGRQVDGGVAALDALPAVVATAGDDVPVLLDSGVRSGSDALKAIALGASAVLLGRPYLWGLATAGEEGVLRVIRSFLAELDLAMALTGHAGIDQVDADAVTRRPA
ncbi:alpha-hydroxy-acid oxidizing protein [Conexibacter sp. SYSU D00693]|uniref:alpha-hydroxy-acid oxidizing protein n=1 Tax=Conexibacter sp. SYSU D00693 TaxID=2812560 RepID=UPI00196AC00F|nr:alpha-hydroxy-acid oxidizing protein [Conexibacter sp. SYSU D00693]